MKGIPPGRYTREFRQEVFRPVVEDKVSCHEAARRLSVAPSTLNYWVKAYKAGKLGEIGNGQKPLCNSRGHNAKLSGSRLPGAATLWQSEDGG